MLNDQRKAYFPSAASSTATDEVLFEKLAPAIGTIATSFTSLSKRLDKMQQVNQSLDKFNSSFSAFLAGMVVNDSFVDWPQAPTQQMIDRYKEKQKSKPVEIITDEPTSMNIDTVTAAEQLNVASVNRKRRAVPEELPTIKRNKRLAVEPVKQKKMKATVKKIIDKLSITYREQNENNKAMQRLLETFIQNPTGLVIQELVDISKLTQNAVRSGIKELVSKSFVLKKDMDVQIRGRKTVRTSYALDQTPSNKYPN